MRNFGRRLASGGRGKQRLGGIRQGPHAPCSVAPPEQDALGGARGGSCHAAAALGQCGRLCAAPAAIQLLAKGVLCRALPPSSLAGKACGFTVCSRGVKLHLTNPKSLVLRLYLYLDVLCYVKTFVSLTTAHNEVLQILSSVAVLPRRDVKELAHTTYVGI